MPLATFRGRGQGGFHNEELSHSKAKRALLGSIGTGHRQHQGFTEQRELPISGFGEDGALAMMVAHEVQASQGSEMAENDL